MDRNFRRGRSNSNKETPKKDINEINMTIGTLRDPSQVLQLPETLSKDTKMPYIVLNKNVEILIDGKKLDTGEFNTLKLFEAQNSVYTLHEKGLKTDEQKEKELDFIQEKGILFNIVRYIKKK